MLLIGVHSPLQYLHNLRILKSDSEIALMRKAGQITAEAFKKVISSL